MKYRVINKDSEWCGLTGVQVEQSENFLILRTEGEGEERHIAVPPDEAEAVRERQEATVLGKYLDDETLFAAIAKAYKGVDTGAAEAADVACDIFLIMENKETVEKITFYADQSTQTFGYELWATNGGRLEMYWRW